MWKQPSMPEVSITSRRVRSSRRYDARATFSARGPFGPWPVWKVTASPSRSSSNETPVQADWWKKYLVAVRGRDEPEALVADQPLDSAVQRSHCGETPESNDEWPHGMCRQWLLRVAGAVCGKRRRCDRAQKSVIATVPRLRRRVESSGRAAWRALKGRARGRGERAPWCACRVGWPQNSGLAHHNPNRRTAVQGPAGLRAGTAADSVSRSGPARGASEQS